MTSAALLFVTLLVVAVALNVALAAWFRRLRGGRFEVTTDTPLLYRLETDLGVFSIDRKHRRFNFPVGESQGHWALDDVSDIKFESSASYAFLLELFYGLEVTDFFKPYRDTIEHFVVYVQTKDGRRMPVFSVGQYKPRDFLMGWAIAMEAIVLGNLRLFVDARDYSRLAYRKVWQAFTDSGISPHAG